MTPTNAQLPSRHFPAGPPPDPEHLRSRLELLDDRRKAGAALAVATSGLLPFAMAWQTLYLAGVVACLIGAGLLSIGCHVTRNLRLAAIAIYPQVAPLPELTRTRERLVSPRSRRVLAHGLRRTASAAPRRNRFCVWPLLPDRVAAVRGELIELADALEQHASADPVAVALLHELLRDGASPLYDAQIPAADLQATLTKVRGYFDLPARGADARSARGATTIRERP